ncbi:MFS transporter [Parvularcula dongshanensis]|uniref:MFS transporter n=1 Tax=Parvularcula dongshanensis TaxID=1173995 RepID=UPI0031B6445F
MLPSWAEHLRHHNRATRHDADTQKAVECFHRGEAPPKFRHLLASQRGPAVPDNIGAPQAVPAP